MNKYTFVLLRRFFSISQFFPTHFAVRLAEKTFTTPLSPERRGIEVELLKRADRFSVQDDAGNTIAVYRWGEVNAPIILFSHGWTSSGTCFIKFIKPLIADGFQVISFDFIAHGETQGKSSASVTQWADALLSVTQETGKIHCIIGHSLGAGAVVVASNLQSAKRKLDVEKIVLISPVTNIIRVTEKFAEEFLIPNNILIKMQSYAWDKYQDNSLKYGDNWHDIFKSNIKIPTLIIHDRDDFDSDIEDSRRLATRIPQSKLIETQKLGHRRILLNPSVIRTCLSFIKN